MTADRTALERTEARLRAACEARVADVPEPDAAAAHEAIERRLSAARRRRALGRLGGGLLAAAAAFAAVVGLAGVLGDDGPEQVRTTDVPTTGVPTTTTLPTILLV